MTKYATIENALTSALNKTIELTETVLVEIPDDKAHIFGREKGGIIKVSVEAFKGSKSAFSLGSDGIYRIK